MCGDDMPEAPCYPMDSAVERAALRGLQRRGRRKLAPWQRRLTARAAAALLSHCTSFQKARSLAAYLADDGELDCAPLIDIAVAAGKEVHVPLVRKNSLLFQVFNRHARIRMNRLGIREPVLDPGLCRFWRQLDLIIVPLVAFDACRNRLGRGGGFYDRTLASARRRPYRRPMLWGYGYDTQLVDYLSPGPTDVPLHAIIVASVAQPGRAWIL